MNEKILENTPIHYWINDAQTTSTIIFVHPAFANYMAKKASAMWHDAEPESEYMEFPNAGHIVNMDAPEQFNKTLKKIIR